jgi:hypothetical protein
MYMLSVREVIQDKGLQPEERYLIVGGYTIIFLVASFILLWFLKFLLTWVFRGVAALARYLAEALNNPQSVAYIASLILLRSVPWYFNLLMIILVFCGFSALITGASVWAEAFKYILGATVGSLIGVVRKQEESEFEESLFNAARDKTMASDAQAKSDKSTSIRTTPTPAADA